MQPVGKSGLEWARHLRGQIVERIQVLRAALADIEPLQQELVRLEAQLKGVDRLIAVQTELLGLPAGAAEPEPPAHESTARAVPEDAASLPPWSLPSPTRHGNRWVWLEYVVSEALRTGNRLSAATRQLYKSCRRWLNVLLSKTSASS